MTDLERLWDDVPSGTPPVDAILQQGRTGAAHQRRKVVVPLVAVAASTALIGAFIAGSQFDEPGAPTSLTPGADASPVAFQADLQPAASCEDLLASYRDRGLAQVTVWGWQPDWHAYGALTDLRTTSVRKLANAARTATATNVQEAGIDEPDSVKSDGNRVVRLHGGQLLVYDTSGSSVAKLSSTPIPNMEGGEILLAGTTVVALGADRLAGRDDITGSRRGTRVVTLSIANPADPVIQSTMLYSSRLVSARLHNSVVRLVMAEGLPDLNFVQPRGKRVTKKQALRENRRVVEESSIEDWLPTYDSGAGAQELLDCTNVATPPDSPGLDTVSVVGFELDAPTSPSAVGLAGAVSTAYVSADHLVLADTSYGWMCGRCYDRSFPVGTQTGGTTHLYDFELNGRDAVHVASGEVEGSIADRWSMDEVDGVLRVAVGPSSETGNFNSVVTFQREGQELVEMGRVDHLGKNEDLKGVRWFDDLAILVTFREVDPLYTIDLSDPANPQRLGKLKIPGFSDYLHPLGDGQLLGVGSTGGSGNRWGAQIALFDTSDLANVRQTDVHQFPMSEAIVTWDTRAFTWLPDRNTVLTVLQKGQRVDVAQLTVVGGKLRSTLTKVDYGSDAGQVRTFGMPDGRVVLVTGDDVEFFSLS